MKYIRYVIRSHPDIRTSDVDRDIRNREGMNELTAAVKSYNEELGSLKMKYRCIISQIMSNMKVADVVDNHRVQPSNRKRAVVKRRTKN